MFEGIHNSPKYTKNVHLLIFLIPIKTLFATFSAISFMLLRFSLLLSNASFFLLETQKYSYTKIIKANWEKLSKPK